MNKNNYHTHTTRCMHAIGQDEEYVQAAIKAGIKKLGFSDHTPWHYDSSFKATMRMEDVYKRQSLVYQKQQIY